MSEVPMSAAEEEMIRSGPKCEDTGGPPHPTTTRQLLDGGRGHRGAQISRWFCRKVKVRCWVICLAGAIGTILTIVTIVTIVMFTLSSPSPDLLTQVPPSSGPSACPADWIKLNHHCYYISENKTSWGAAQDFCRHHGASLVKLTDNTKDNFRKLNINDDFWIGLKRNQSTWNWTDRTKYNQMVADYQEDRSLDCAYLNGEVRALDCSTSRRFICSKSVI